MIKKRNLIAGLVFLVCSVLVISLLRPTPFLFPTQENKIKENTISFGNLYENFIFRQEVTVKKDYLYGLECWFANYRQVTNIEAVVMVTDTNLNILYSRKFESKEIVNPRFYPFNFGKRIKIGSGNTIYLCIYALNGNQEVFLTTAKDDSLSGKGDFSIHPLVNNDVTGSLRGQGQVFPGTLLYRTHESSGGWFSWMHGVLYALAILVALVILFYPKIRTTVAGWKIPPEKIYPALALTFGIAWIFFTGPLQVPDEDKHFFRAYQVSEFNLFNNDPTVPLALTKLDTAFQTMRFKPFIKTSAGEITSRKKGFDITGERVPALTSPYFISFVPQAFGIAIGRITGASPLVMLYLGRLVNLLVSVLLVLLAIRITPANKWIFFLLGLMPMTLYLFASVSHDSLTISLTFLVTAWFLRLAMDPGCLITRKRILVTLLLVFLLALCKPPYFLVALLYFLIPVQKIGSVKKYAAVFAVMLILVLAGLQFNALGKLFKPVAPPSNAAALSGPASADTAGTAVRQKTFDQTRAQEKTNAAEQRRFILENPGKYAGILYNSLLVRNRPFYIESFIGKFGWLEFPIPKWVRTFYWVFLFLAAILLPFLPAPVNWRGRLLIAGIFVAGMGLVMTAMYLGWTAVGNEVVEGVQGRYFIPLAPLFFFLLAARFPSEWLNGLKMASGRTAASRPGKPAKGKKEYRLVGPYVRNLVELMVIGFVMLSLAVCTFAILTRYFIILA